MRRKVTVVGGGNVGASCAHRLAERDYADVVLIDSDLENAADVAVDINVACSIVDHGPSVTGTDRYEDLSGSDIVIIAVDAEDNAAAAAEIAAEVRDRAPDSVVIVVSNPLEGVCHAVYDVLEFPRERVVGMAGALHSAALRMTLAGKLDVSPHDVDAVVLGGHADTMVPLLSCATVAGIAIRKRIGEEEIDDAVERVRKAAAPREASLASVYAPAAALTEMVDSILLDHGRVLPCVALTKGEYGFEEVFVGLPVKLSSTGIAEIIEMNLDDDERRQLEEGVRAVEELVGSRARV
jgi:malate dehydrogenase